MRVAISFAILASMLPFSLASVQEPSATKLVNAVQTQYLTPIPPKDPAKPIAAGTNLRRIHPQGRSDLCITVQGGEIIGGAEVGIAYVEPDGSARADWQKWDMKLAQAGGGGQIKASNAQYCLSIGDDTSDAARPRLEKCVDAGAAKDKGQMWAVTRLSIKNMKNNCNQCIDIRLQSPVYEGKGWISQRDVQTWACANATAHENNPQQVWDLMLPDGNMAGSAPGRRAQLKRGRRSF